MPLLRDLSDDTSEDHAEDSRDPRMLAAWRTWLGALETDPKAAFAAALAYEALAPEGRDAWLDALDADAAAVAAPRLALYAPLLAVEADETRRGRIARALTGEETFRAPPHALVARPPSGGTVCVIVSPVYLDFVELLVCRFRDEGIDSARHEPLAHLRGGEPVPEAEGAEFEVAPLDVVVEDLAHAVVAHRRAGREPPEVLLRFSHLFVPQVGERVA